jgi:hypothetical protein
VTNKDMGFGLVTGFFLLLQYFVTVPVSGTTATYHSSQFTRALLWLLLEWCLSLSLLLVTGTPSWPNKVARSSCI